MNNPLTILCIGAHPDDCEFSCSGTAAKFAAKGARIIITSVTDGRSGHHELPVGAVIEQRREESIAAAAVIGAESRNLGAPDGALEATLEYRYKVIRLVREIRPDLIITNRPNDYHPDHRYTSLLVQDSAYMFMVPHVVPEVQALEYNPIILYWGDTFTYPREIRPDIVVDIDDVLDTKRAMLAAHESQVYEWLPWIDRYPDPPPSDVTVRGPWLKTYLSNRSGPTYAERFRERLCERYGEASGAKVVDAEVYELCEYGARPNLEDLELMFTGI